MVILIAVCLFAFAVARVIDAVTSSRDTSEPPAWWEVAPPPAKRRDTSPDILFRWDAYLCVLHETTQIGQEWIDAYHQRHPGIRNSYVGHMLTRSLHGYSQLATASRRAGLTCELHGKRGARPSPANNADELEGHRPPDITQA